MKAKLDEAINDLGLIIGGIEQGKLTHNQTIKFINVVINDIKHIGDNIERESKRTRIKSSGERY